MTKRIRVTGVVDAPGPGIDAFTPEGERAWAGPEWDPVYPDANAAFEPGLVFLAAGAVWVVVDAGPEHVRYARVTPGERAGIVAVERRDDATVEVTYDLTALTAGAGAALRAFEAAYPAMLAGWTRELRGARRASGCAPPGAAA